MSRGAGLGLVLAGGLAACGAAGGDSGGVVPDVPTGDPGIVGLHLSCDPVDALWDLRVRTDAWSARAELWLTTDGQVVEQHAGSSQQARADGTEDCLQARVVQVVDPADAGSGATRWLCGEAPDLSYLVLVTDSRGQRVTDCRTWGAHPAVWSSVEGAQACDRVLEDGPDTGAAVGDEGSLGSCDF